MKEEELEAGLEGRRGERTGSSGGGEGAERTKGGMGKGKGTRTGTGRGRVVDDERDAFAVDETNARVESGVLEGRGPGRGGDRAGTEGGRGEGGVGAGERGRSTQWDNEFVGGTCKKMSVKTAEGSGRDKRRDEPDR